MLLLIVKVITKDKLRLEFYKMNKKNKTIISSIILLIAVVGAYFIVQPSAKDILQKTLETTKTIESAHIIAEIEFTSPEENGAGKVEVWVQHNDTSGMFRMVVLESSRNEAVGAIIVSDGETLWAYSPQENKVFTGTLEEAKVAFEENQSHMEKFDYDQNEYEHPENTEEAIDMLLEYVDAKKSGTDTIANSKAYQIELKPIAEQMPAEYIAVGGILNIWIDKSRSIPLSLSYTGGTLGEFTLSAIEAEINLAIDDSIFAFDIPADAEIIQLVDLIPESLSMDDAIASAEFDVLTPAELPAGATLVDVITIQGMIVQQYTFPEGGSFTVNQGITAEIPFPSTEMETVSVRGVSGNLFVSEDNNQVMLTWIEGEINYFIAGDITTEQAIAIAESLK
jgi:outer membrane lipoprotein-sorting protein